jgi:hypothetical protein
MQKYFDMFDCIYRNKNLVGATLTHVTLQVDSLTAVKYVNVMSRLLCRASVAPNHRIIDLQHLVMVRARSRLHACRSGSTCNGAPRWRQGRSAWDAFIGRDANEDVGLDDI